jgi:CHAT domain-containing protein
MWAAESASIEALQAQFRGLGGNVTPAQTGSDYSFPGRPKAPFETASVLRRLRDAHLARSADRSQDVDQLLSALQANRTGRDLLQVERDNTSLLDPAARSRVSRLLRDFYDAEVDLGWRLLADVPQYIEPMFRDAELSRARDFMGSVYRRMDLGRQPGAEAAFARFEALVGYRETLAALQDFQVSDDRLRAYLAVLRRSLTARLGKLDKAGLAQFDNPKAADSGVGGAALQASLIGIGEALIMYHVTESGAYAFVIVRNRPPKVVRLPGSTAMLRERIRTYHALLSKGPSDRGITLSKGTTQADWRDIGHQLYEALFQSLEPYIGRADRLMIVPHDLIHLVPFAALPTSRTGSEGFMVDRYTMAMLPTPMFRGWSGMRRREATGAIVVGIDEFSLAGRLSYAEEEARSVARILPASELLLGSRGQATYRNVLNKIGSYSVIHIASHGSYLSSAPGASHVLLRGQRGEGDEALMAVDILGTRLNATTVVLSACQTATTREAGLPPDGDILGLPRSFLIAGAANVVASLWAVNDQSTRKFFEYLYRAGLAGALIKEDVVLSDVGLDAALVSAQRRLKTEYPDPFYWAPFVLIGG